MAEQHVFAFDGYHTSEEHILEGVMFEVHVTETDEGDLVITKVVNPERDKGYLAKFSTEFFEGDSVDPGIHGQIRRQVQENIDHLREFAAKEGRTLSQELDIWDAERPSNMERIDLLGEV